jgi:hypothetical protein
MLFSVALMYVSAHAYTNVMDTVYRLINLYDSILKCDLIPKVYDTMIYFTFIFWNLDYKMN